MAKILVVDDEQSVVWALERFLRSLGHEVVSAATGEAGLEIARREDPDLVLLDVKLPGMDGLSALEALQASGARAKVVVLTAHGTLETAVKALKLGAFEYLSKPVDLSRARAVVEEALRRPAESREIERLRGEKLGSLVGKTPAMQRVFRTIATVCDSDATVLITGESGTGKEMVARAIHYHSRRASGPFEAINGSSIPETLLESELYGHEKGAFTGAIRRKLGLFEIASGGTAFLDEVADIPPAAQVKLLRFIETRTLQRVGGNESVSIDVRLLAATNRPLEELVKAGRFREDLFFRLNVLRIDLPLLRERSEDIPLLVAHFLEQIRGASISEETLALLRSYAWPGNVRELRNAIERASVLSRGTIIRPEHLPESLAPSARPHEVDERVRDLVDDILAAGSPPEGGWFRHVEEKWERALLARALERCGGNQVRASELLGINRMTLRKKMDQYGLRAPNSDP